MRNVLRPLVLVLVATAVLPAQEVKKVMRLVPSPAVATQQDPSAAQKKREPIYDEAADASGLVAAALAKAKKENKRVLLMYGGNWCGWCYKLHDTLTTQPAVRREMMYEYELVHIDVGHGDKNAELSARFGSEHKQHGYPYLTVVDADGNTVTHKDTAELEEGSAHDPKKVLEFLKANEATPLDACAVLAQAQQTAKADGKLLFVHIGAPWCGWCHRLEDWMARPEIAALLQKDFVDVKIDQDRMTNGRVVATLLRQGKSGGIPWIVLMDAELRPLVTSDGPKGNTGFPSQPEEIEHFAAMLSQVKKNLTDDDVATLVAALRAPADGAPSVRHQE